MTLLVEFDRDQPPKVTGCGLLWECFDPRHPQVDFAVCDMPWPALPHYHQHMVECYRISSGLGHVWVGDEVVEAWPGSHIFIPPGAPHWTVPLRAESHQPLQMEVSNSPGWNSFDEPDFCLLDPEVPEHRLCLAEWYLAMAAELAVRRHLAQLPPMEGPPLSAAQLVEELCLPDYRSYFEAVEPDFAGLPVPVS